MTNEKVIDIFNRYIACHNEVRCYTEIMCKDCEYNVTVEEMKEAIQMAISALEKQEAKKPDMIWDTTFGKIRPHCLVCGASNPTGANYCWNCGQRFISEEEL